MPPMSHSRNIWSRKLAPVAPTGSWPETVTIRRANADDTQALARLAAVLDNELELQRTFGSLRPRTVFGSQSPSPDTA